MTSRFDNLSPDLPDRGDPKHWRDVRVIALALFRECTPLLRQESHPSITRRDLELAAVLHDKGKQRLPKRIFSVSPKPALSRSERALMQTHPEISAKIAAELGQSLQVQEGVRQHHMGLNGTGYPKRTSGETIKPIGRILNVADALATATSARLYLPKVATDAELIRQFRTNNNGASDPVVSRAAIRLLRSPSDQQFKRWWNARKKQNRALCRRGKHI